MAMPISHETYLVRYMLHDSGWAIAKRRLSSLRDAEAYRDAMIERNPHRRIEIDRERITYETVDVYTPPVR